MEKDGDTHALFFWCGKESITWKPHKPAGVWQPTLALTLLDRPLDEVLHLLECLGEAVHEECRLLRAEAQETRETPPAWIGSKHRDSFCQLSCEQT